jgi:drug/metabolite transporter (DMT)-like permease
MTEPLFTIGLSAVLFAERLTLLQAAGGILVLAGTILLTVVRQHRGTNSKDREGPRPRDFRTA